MTCTLCPWPVTRVCVAPPGVGISHHKILCAEHQLTQLVIANILPFFFFFHLWVEEQPSRKGEAHGAQQCLV